MADTPLMTIPGQFDPVPTPREVTPRADGRVAIGTTQDFADSGLPELLRAFAASPPRVRIELRVGRSAELGAETPFDQP